MVMLRLYLLVGTLLPSSVGGSFSDLTLPPVVYGTEGWEGNVYFDNIQVGRYDSYVWEVSATSRSHHSLPNGTTHHDMGDFIAGTVRQQVERIVFVPKLAMATDLFIRVTDAGSGTQLGMGNTTLVTTNRTAGSNTTATLLVIGDSLTSGGEHTAVLEAIAQNDSMGLRLIGSRGQSTTNRHEGRGGWTVHDYATSGRQGFFFVVHGMHVAPGGDPATSAPEEKYTIEIGSGKAAVECTIWNVNLTMPNGTGVLGATCLGTVPPTGVLARASTNAGDEAISYSSYSIASLNPFWSGSMTAGKLDVAAYLQRYNLPVPNAATIMLGDNDLSGVNTDDEADTAFATIIPNLQLLVEALHSAGVMSVGLVLQPPPSDQDGFGADYGVMENTGPPSFTQVGVNNAYRMKRVMLRWWKAQMKLAVVMEGSDILCQSARASVTVVPAGLNLDTQHSMSRTTGPANARSDPTDPMQQVVRAINGVHPGLAGQAQIADSFWAWLKFRMSL
eukprot:m.110882 g.110882  ORF g.110882 m.110882 type:complete len:502 (+) comp28075_c1_seq6:235-1740(+)